MVEADGIDNFFEDFKGQEIVIRYHYAWNNYHKNYHNEMSEGI